MHRIDTVNHDNNLFTEGNPATGNPGTVVSAAWLNDVQENVARVVERFLPLTKGRGEDLSDALDLLVGAVGVQRLDNVAAFRALAPAAPVTEMAALTLGYHEPGDGGGGLFHWSAGSTTAEDGGTVIRPTAIGAGTPGRWLLDHRGVANARQFGAYADGTSHPLGADFATLAEAQAVYPHAVDLVDQRDWAAAHAALKFAVEETGRCYLPRGKYWFNRTAEHLACGRDVEIFGDGRETYLFRPDGSIIENAGVSNRLLRIDPAAGSQINVRIHDLYCDHNARGNTHGGSGFSWEQLGSIRVSAVGERSANVYAHDLWFRDPVADCINCASGSSANTFGTLAFRNIHNRQRDRTRFDISITGSYDRSIVSDCDLTTIRIEINSKNATHRHDMLLSNVSIRPDGIPLGAAGYPNAVVLEGGASDRPSVALVVNCDVLGNINARGADYWFVNTKVHSDGLSAQNRLLEGRFRFIGGSITFTSAVNTGEGILCSGATTTPEVIEFHGTEIVAEDGANFDNAMLRVASPMLGRRSLRFVGGLLKANGNRLLWTRDCLLDARGLVAEYGTLPDTRTAFRLDPPVDAAQRTEWSFKGCRFRGTGYVFRPARRNCTFRLRGNTYDDVTKIWNTTGSDGTLLASDFAAERVDGTSFIQTPELDDFDLATLPVSGLFLHGQKVRPLAPTQGGIVEYVCTTRGSPGNWHVSRQAGHLASIGSAPAFVGQIAVVAGVGYMATGTAGTGDWKQITA